MGLWSLALCQTHAHSRRVFLFCRVGAVCFTLSITSGLGACVNFMMTLQPSIMTTSQILSLDLSISTNSWIKYRLIQTAVSSRSIGFFLPPCLWRGALSRDGQPAQVSLSPWCGLWPATLLNVACCLALSLHKGIIAHQAAWLPAQGMYLFCLIQFSMFLGTKRVMRPKLANAIKLSIL